MGQLGRSRLKVAGWHSTPSTVTFVLPGVTLHLLRVASHATCTDTGEIGQGSRLTPHLDAGSQVPGSRGSV